MADTIKEEGVQSLGAEVGAPTSPDGITQVNVDREGTFVVVHEWVGDEPRKGRTERATGDESDVQREEVRGDIREFLDESPDELFTKLGGVNVEDDFPPRPGLPDEPILTITIEGDGERHVVRMWLRDAENDPGVAPLLESLRSLVEGATDARRFL
jgi:hypothetical protein